MFVLNNGQVRQDGAALLDGRGLGAVGQHLQRMHFDAGFMRPYIDRNGDLAVTVNTGRWTVEKGERKRLREHRRLAELALNGIFASGGMVTNATALRKEEWIELDRTVLRAARYRLNFWADLASANSFGGFNGMAKTILEYEAMADPGEAIVDMDGISEGRGDRPMFQLRGLPLPITHSDFSYSARQLATSRNSGTPLDVTMGEAAGRRIGETIEKTAIGIQTGMAYGGTGTLSGGGAYDITSKVYGLVNFPKRLTKTNAYLPTGNGRSGTGWVPADTLKDVLAALDQLRLNKFYGPFTIYHSNDWDQYLDNDYFLTSTATNTPISTKTLRERLVAIKGITDCKRLDFLFASQPSATTGPGGEYLAATYPFTMILVQMTPDVARAVNGLDITTVQWETKGGMQLNFKVMAIQVAQLRADYYGNCGILHMTANN